MSGGGALLRNVDKLLTQVTGVPCHVAENPLNCVALGTGPGAGALRLLQEVPGPADLGAGGRRMARAFIDLHCHTRASFDCLSKPADVVRAGGRSAA